MTDREKRRFRRIDFRKPLEFHTVEYCDGQPNLREVATVSCDLSEAGLRFYARDFLPLGQEMTLSFSLAEDRTFRVPGKVVWTQKIPHGEMFQAGISFTYQKAGMTGVRKELQQYIDFRE